MTKKSIVKKLIEQMVWESFYAAYGIGIEEPTEKQLKLVNEISDKIYEFVGKKFTHKELRKWPALTKIVSINAIYS